MIGQKTLPLGIPRVSSRFHSCRTVGSVKQISRCDKVNNWRKPFESTDSSKSSRVNFITDCLKVIWNSLCKPSRFKAVETSAKHYLPATREAPKIISRALQAWYSQKKRAWLSVCVLTSELEARKVSHARLIDSHFTKINLPCLSTGLFVSSEFHRTSRITSANHFSAKTFQKRRSKQ